MRLIDGLRQAYTDLAAAKLRVAGWCLDAGAVEQLRREVGDDGMGVSDTSSPLTFLGVPIETVSGARPAKADFIMAHYRFAPCQHASREHDRAWDIFDLDAGQPHGAFYRSKAEAEAAAMKLDRELELPRNPKKLH